MECPDCGHVWNVLLMRRTDRNPPCPECESKPVESFPAPRLARGAEPSTSIRVPENKTKAIDLAMRIASEDNGGANFQTTSRPGEAVAIPVPQEREAAWGGQGKGKLKIPLDYGTAAGAAAADGFRGRNSNILDALATKRAPYMRPVYRTPK